MSESEKLIRAKIYVDKLANSINPIDDSEIPLGNLINDVRLSRCLFFLSVILRQVIESDSVGAKPQKTKKCPFELSFEARTRFSYSEAPLTISEISKRINELIDVQSRRMVYIISTKIAGAIPFSAI